MGLRTRLAERYAVVERPRILRFTGNAWFSPPVVFRSLVFPTRTSRNLAIAASLPEVSVDLHPRSAAPSAIPMEFPILPPTPETARIDISGLIADGVSQNLLTPIGKPDPRGKNYAPATQQRALFGDDNTGRLNGHPGRPSKDNSPRTVLDRPIRHTPALWDLILPLLRPPLDFDLPAQLDLPSDLYPFQVEGVRRLVENHAFLLADEMGTGKTVMAAVALRVLLHNRSVRRALIVCPAGVLSVWDTHLADWCGHEVLCSNIRGSREVRRAGWGHPAHVYLVSYDTLRNDVLGRRPLVTNERLAQFDLAVLDEIHYIRNQSSGRARAVKRVSSAFRWGLSGTPMQNSLSDLVAVFSFLKPGLLSDDCTSASASKDRIGPFFLRRLKKDVMEDLPEKIVEERWLTLDPRQRQAYDAAIAQGRADLVAGGTRVARVHVFTLLRRLMGICNFAPAARSSPKLSQLLEQIEEVIEEHKVVVFSNCIGEGVDKIRPMVEKYGVAEITGRTPVSRRREVIDAFQRDPDIRVFLGTPKAAGEGISLTKAGYVFHFDQWWNPAVAWQAEDRVHRKGQRGQVNVYSYFMEHTVEERIRDKLREKGLLFEEVIGALSTEDIESCMTMADWCEVLGLELGAPKEGGEAQGGGAGLPETHARMASMPPVAFEQLVAEVFRRRGYTTRTTKGSHDGGVDVFATRAGLGGKEVVVIQCKRKREVGVDAARELLGVVSADRMVSRGFLVVSGRLSRGCREFINQHGMLSAIEGLELARRAMKLGIDV